MRQEFETLQDTLSRLYEEEDRYNVIITNGEMSEEEWQVLMTEHLALMDEIEAIENELDKLYKELYVEA